MFLLIRDPKHNRRLCCLSVIHFIRAISKSLSSIPDFLGAASRDHLFQNLTWWICFHLIFWQTINDLINPNQMYSPWKVITICCDGSKIPYTLFTLFSFQICPLKWIFCRNQNSSVTFDLQKLHKATHPRPLPDHASYPVALVEERVVDGGEAGILEEEATLQALPLQGGVVLPLKGLDGGEHPAALEESWRHSEHLRNKKLFSSSTALLQPTLVRPRSMFSRRQEANGLVIQRRKKNERKSSLVAPIES